MDRVVEDALFGGLDLGDVGKRADDSDHLAGGVDDRARLEGEAVIAAVGAAQPDIMADTTRALLQHALERRREAVAIKRMENVEPARGRAFQSAALEAELRFDLAADVDLVGGHIPVEDRIAAAGHGERAPLTVGAARPGRARAGESAMHDGEANQHDDQHQAADQSWRGNVIGQLAERRRAGRRHPNDEQKPGRDQHHRAIRAARPIDRMSRKPIAATVAIEMRATPAAIGAL